MRTIGLRAGRDSTQQVILMLTYLTLKLVLYRCKELFHSRRFHET